MSAKVRGRLFRNLRQLEVETVRGDGHTFSDESYRSRSVGVRAQRVIRRRGERKSGHDELVGGAIERGSNGRGTEHDVRTPRERRWMDPRTSGGAVLWSRAGASR